MMRITSFLLSDFCLFVLALLFVCFSSTNVSSAILLFLTSRDLAFWVQLQGGDFSQLCLRILYSITVTKDEKEQIHNLLSGHS